MNDSTPNTAEGCFDQLEGDLHTWWRSMYDLTLTLVDLVLLGMSPR